MEMEITLSGNLRVDSFYKGFTVHTDQPKDEGGDGSAPEPFDLFLSSIGTCAGVYILFFCRKRNLDSTGIRLTMNFRRNEKTRMVEHIDMKISLPETFPNKYQDALRKVAEGCMVKKHLATPPKITISTSFHG